jgi:predicted CoA-binding protein
MVEFIQKMLAEQTWAVVGATQSEDKFGYKILMRLRSAGYDTYAVNPRYQEIEGTACYDSLKALPIVPACVDMVVSPKRAYPFIDEAAELGVKFIWFQPGTFDDHVIKYAEEKGLLIVFHHCVLVELSKIGK